MSRDYWERAPEDRDRERAKRALARQTKVSRKTNRRPWWLYAAALALLALALVVSMFALFSGASMAATVALALIAFALVA